MPEIIFGPGLTVVCQHVTDGQRESLCMIEREREEDDEGEEKG